MSSYFAQHSSRARLIDRRLTLWVLAVSALAGTLLLGGCAGSPTYRPVGLAEKIERARTRSDHETLASAYEQQARASRTAVQQSESFARTYQGSRSFRGTELYQLYCNLSREYRQAAEENAAPRDLHQQLAAEAEK